MVIVILESVVIMLTTLFVCSQAFWWSSPTTESTPVVKQIPVGYFRTYTYQPLSYPATYSNYPYVGSHHSFTAGSGPFGSWSQRQSYSNNPPPPPPPSPSISTPGLSALKLTAPPTVPITTQPPPPPPTQPPTQSPASQYVHMNPSNSQSNQPVQPQPYSNLPIMEAHPPSSSSPNIQIQQISPPSHSSINNNGYPSSPHYYQSSSNQESPQNYHNYYTSGNVPMQQQIQFVPCMCPVSVSVSSEFPESRADHLVEDEPLERSDQVSKEETH